MQFNKSDNLEKQCNKYFLPLFFNMNKVEICEDYKRNHEEGTDAIINGVKIDFKFALPTVKYKYRDFFIEEKQANGHGWLDDNLDVYICYFWFRKDGSVEPKFYHKSYLKKVLFTLKAGNKHRKLYSDCNTSGYYLNEEELTQYEMPKELLGIEVKKPSKVAITRALEAIDYGAYIAYTSSSDEESLYDEMANPRADLHRCILNRKD